MKHAKWIVLAVVVLALTLPAVAGEKEHYECTMETQACLNKMVAKFKDRGWVGIEMDQSEDGKTLTVHRVVPGSPAEAAGFKVDDALVAVNGVRFADNTEEKCVTCEATKDDWSPGSTVRYTVNRGGKKVTVSPTLGQIPSDVMAAWIGGHMLDHAKAVEIAQN